MEELLERKISDTLEPQEAVAQYTVASLAPRGDKSLNI